MGIVTITTEYFNANRSPTLWVLGAESLCRVQLGSFRRTKPELLYELR